MGLSLSAFNMFGLPGLSSMTAGQVYDQHFKKRPTNNFTDFHLAYVDFCKYLNTVLPGQDFDTPSLEEIREFYKKWAPLPDHDKKEEFMKYVKANVREASVDSSIFIMAGLAVPAAAIMAKRAGETIPQAKKLQYVPNVIFVPLCTLFAIMGVTAVQMNKSKSNPT